MGFLKELLPYLAPLVLVVPVTLAGRMPGRKLRARMAVSCCLGRAGTTTAYCRRGVLSREEVACLAATHGYYLIEERPVVAGRVRYRFRRAPEPPDGVAWWCA